MFCGREAIVSLAEEACNSSSTSDSNTDIGNSGSGGRAKRLFFRLLRPAVATLWFAASLAAALLVPNIGAVIQQLGSLVSEI